MFSDKNSDILRISAQNIDCGYSLEPPWRGGSNEYPQSMFLSRNKKNNVYTCEPQFYYIKVGFKRVKIISVCPRDVLFFFLNALTLKLLNTIQYGKPNDFVIVVTLNFLIILSYLASLVVLIEFFLELICYVKSNQIFSKLLASRKYSVCVL